MDRSNCRQFTESLAAIKSKRSDLDSFINESRTEDALRIKDELSELVEALMKETSLGQNQRMLDFVFGGKRFNLQEAQRKGEILNLSKEQREHAEKEGYSLEVIIPGQLPREEVIQVVKDKYAREFSSDGLYSFDTEKGNKDITAAALNPNRPSSFYTIRVRPQLKVKDSHPETMLKTVGNLQELLHQKQRENPELNLLGLTLPEYLLLDSFHFQNGGTHLDTDQWSYLLAETFRVSSNPYLICLRTGWDEKKNRIHFDSESGQFPHNGARFAVVAKENK